jgi:hypothetical protein
MMSFYEKRSSLARELAQLCDEDDGEELDFLFIESRWFTPPLPPPPQVGRAFKLGWSTIAGYLSRPSVGPSESEQSDPDKAKRTGGGYSIARYAQNLRRVANLVHVHALAVDVDGGDASVHRCARLLSDYRAIVHETFKSTIEAPRCRRRRRRVPLSPESPVPRDPPAGAETVFRDVLSGGDAHEGGALGSMALRSAVSSPLRGEIGIRLGRCDSLSRARSAPRAR